MLQRLLRLFRLPLAGVPRLLRTEARLLRLSQEHHRNGRDLRREVEAIDQQIAQKQTEIAAEGRQPVLAVLQAELHSLKKALERRATRIAVLADQRDHVGNLLEKLQVTRLAAGTGAVSVEEIDSITTQVENAAAALEDRRYAMRDLDATPFTTDYAAPALQPTTQPAQETARRTTVETRPSHDPVNQILATDTAERTNQ
ncbi:MAG: hypothetical protein JNK49_14500 [Planctomycetes bacterium]|nr:hypothetical protein [Planctomycetota bacterium]